MTPKEEAKELVNKFIDPVRWKLGQENVSQRAKECALIAVDEIINSIVIFDLTAAENQFTYWEEVKQEIEKL